MNENTEAYIGMAALAGSVTGLAMMDWKKMGWKDIGMTLIVGIGFAIFGVPAIASSWFRIDVNDLRTICGFTYFGGVGANLFLPVILRKLKRQLGAEDGV